MPWPLDTTTSGGVGLTKLNNLDWYWKGLAVREPRIGLVQKGTENEQVGREMLEGLLERGVNIDEGLLCVIDGSKGVRKALCDVLEDKAWVQRCQCLKREADMYRADNIGCRTTGEVIF